MGAASSFFLTEIIKHDIIYIEKKKEGDNVVGYYTSHKLEYDLEYRSVSSKTTEEEIFLYIKEHKNINYALSQTLHNSSFGERCKWYEHQQDMRDMSKKFPKVLFILQGEGEEAGDVWKEYYLNGKMQRAQAQLIFEEFNESKLKDVEDERHW